MGKCKTYSFSGVSMLAAACIWVALLTSCASKSMTLFKLVPADGNVSSASIDDNRVVLSARYLDAGQRMMYLRENGYEALGLGLRPVSMTTFALSVKNGSDQNLILDPGSIRLVVGYGPLLAPYNYAHLYMELPQGSGRKKILLDLRKAIFDKSTTIKPGEVQDKLLFFARPEKVGLEAAILFERLVVGKEEFKAVLDFTAVDLEK